MLWTWDPDKDEVNQHKHRLSFETASSIFDDPLAISQPDPYPNEERWQTIGRIGQITILVVHTEPEMDHTINVEVGRIISARKATAHERKIYEEGNF